MSTSLTNFIGTKHQFGRKLDCDPEIAKGLSTEPVSENVSEESDVENTPEETQEKGALYECVGRNVFRLKKVI